MKEISLTRGLVALVDDEDCEELMKYKWCASSANGFACRSILISSKPKKSKTVPMHRYIMGVSNGDPRSVEHIDGNKCNNQKSNLRVYTPRVSAPLTQERLKELFDYDPVAGQLIWKFSIGLAKAGDEFGTTKDWKGYLRNGIDGEYYFVHRVVWLYHYGSWPTVQIDHINGIKDDNRIENLREATPSQNKCNTPVRRDSASRIKGVHQDKRTGRWRAYINVDGKRVHLGFFATKAEAAEKRLKASHLHGEFAREN
jgi:HNH endonuclease/AP2 domain